MKYNNPRFEIVKHFKFTKSQLTKMNAAQRLDVYKAFVNDEMSPIMWRGFGKKGQIEGILMGGSFEVISQGKNDIVFGAEKWLLEPSSLIPTWMNSHEVPIK